jgi:hypothetical protein
MKHLFMPCVIGRRNDDPTPDSGIQLRLDNRRSGTAEESALALLRRDRVTSDKDDDKVGYGQPPRSARLTQDRDTRELSFYPSVSAMNPPE